MPAATRWKHWLILALILVLAACGGNGTDDTESIDPETSSPGAYSEGSDVFVVYPDDAAPLMDSAVDFTKRWFAETNELGFPAFGVTGDGVLSSSRVDDELRVWVDLATGGLFEPVRLAQLTIENRATDGEDSVYVEQLIPAFLAAAGVEPVPHELGLDTVDLLFDGGRTAQLTIDGVTIYLAMNKFSLVLGATGG